jgi:hypothetical protein
MIEKKPFVKYDLNSKSDVVTVKLNSEERATLEQCKAVIEQKKDSTAIKQLAEIGAKVVLGTSLHSVLDIIFKNKRRNRRTGVEVEFE